MIVYLTISSALLPFISSSRILISERWFQLSPTFPPDFIFHSLAFGHAHPALQSILPCSLKLVSYINFQEFFFFLVFLF